MLAVPLGEWVVLCLLSGAVAAVLMNIPMAVQPDGYRPAYVAAGGLRGIDPAEVSDAAAVLVHHVTGTAAGLVYGAVVFVLAAVLPRAVPLNGIPAIPHLVGAVAVTLFIFYFFERIALPRAGGSFREDAEGIVQQWALSSFIYGTTLGLFLPVVVTQF